MLQLTISNHLRLKSVQVRLKIQNNKQQDVDMKQSLKLASLTCAITLALAGCSQSTVFNSTANPQVTQTQSVKNYDAGTFFDTTSITGNSFSSTGDKILVSSDESGIYSLYEVDAKTGGKTRLTNFEDSTYPVRYFLNDDRVLLPKIQVGMNDTMYTCVKLMAQ